MIGKKDFGNFRHNTFTDDLDLIVPLNFWFCKNIGSAIPCIAMKYHDINLNIKWRKFDDLWISNKDNIKPDIPNISICPLWVLAQIL